MAALLSHADRQMDRPDEANTRFMLLCEHVGKMLRKDVEFSVVMEYENRKLISTGKQWHMEIYPWNRFQHYSPIRIMMQTIQKQLYKKMDTSCCTWQPGMHCEYSNSLWAGWSENLKPDCSNIFHTHPDWPWAPPSPLYNG